MLEGIVIGLTVSAIVGAAVWLRVRWPRLRGWVAKRLDARREAQARRTATGERVRAVGVAKRQDQVVAVSARGTNPTRVKWAGAQELETFEYSDLRRYKADVRSGRVPRARAHCCRRVRVGDHRRVAQA